MRLLIICTRMIDKQALAAFINSRIEGTPLFLVDVKVSAANDIAVELDSPDGVDLDTCAALSRDIEQEFPREPEDYSLEVGGAGLTAPFKVRGQYDKNVGNRLDLLAGGRRLTATLLAVNDEDIEVSYPVKVKAPGEKKPHMEERTERIPYTDIKKAQLHLDF